MRATPSSNNQQVGEAPLTSGMPATCCQRGPACQRSDFCRRKILWRWPYFLLGSSDLARGERRWSSWLRGTLHSSTFHVLSWSSFFSPLITVINLADPSQHHSSYFHPCRSYKKPFEWSLGLVSSPCAAGEGGSHHLQLCDPPRTYAVTHTKATARCIGHRNQR